MRTEMDNGIACESVHEETGECTTGEAFATCAGFLAYALDKAFGEDFASSDATKGLSDQSGHLNSHNAAL